MVNTRIGVSESKLKGVIIVHKVTAAISGLANFAIGNGLIDFVGGVDGAGLDLLLD